MWKVNTNMCRQCRRTGNVVIFCCTRAGNGVYRLIVLLLDLKNCQNGKMLCKYNNICTTSLPIEHGPRRNAPVPLRPAVLRFIPEPPGHPGSWTGVNRVKMTFFCRKISTVDRRGPQRPGAPRGTPVHPGRAPAGPRFIPALTRFTPVLGRFSTVHPGPCRQNPGDATVLPGSPRRSYGPSRFTTVHPGEVKMQYK